MTHYGIMQHPVYTQNEFKVKCMNEFRPIEPMARVNAFDQIEYNIGFGCFTADKNYAFQHLDRGYKTILPKIETTIPFNRGYDFHPVAPKRQYESPFYPEKKEFTIY